MEVSVLSRGGEAIGYLVELPEAIDLSRVEIQAEADGVAYRPTVVPSPDDTRLFVFQRTSGGVAALPDGLHRLTLRFHRELGDRNPRYYHRDGLTTEEAVLEFSVPEDEFTGEVEP
jgi:hypothetical protein